MDGLLPTLSEFFQYRSSRKSQPFPVHVGAELIGAGKPHQHWRGVRHQTKALFTFDQRLFGLFAVSDIGGNAENASLLLDFNQLSRCLRNANGAVFPTKLKFDIAKMALGHELFCESHSLVGVHPEPDFKHAASQNLVAAVSGQAL